MLQHGHLLSALLHLQAELRPVAARQDHLGARPVRLAALLLEIYQGSALIGRDPSGLCSDWLGVAD